MHSAFIGRACCRDRGGHVWSSILPVRRAGAFNSRNRLIQRTLVCHTHKQIDRDEQITATETAMHTIKRILGILAEPATPAAVIIAACCSLGLSGVTQGAETNVFQWESRPQLTAEQLKMLGLEKSSQMGAPDSPLRARRQADLASLQKKLGPLAVRYAKPQELVMSRLSTNVCSIYNPTAEGLMLTVAIVGDVEQLGRTMASIGRQAYFPPSNTIIVTNLSWTSPATKKPHD